MHIEELVSNFAIERFDVCIPRGLAWSDEMQVEFPIGTHRSVAWLVNSGPFSNRYRTITQSRARGISREVIDDVHGLDRPPVADAVVHEINRSTLVRPRHQQNDIPPLTLPENSKTSIQSGALYEVQPLEDEGRRRHARSRFLKYS